MREPLYYWDMDEYTLFSENPCHSHLAYYRKQSTEARRIIESISPQSIVPSIARLNMIDEKLILLFFFRDNFFRNFSELKEPEHVIELIEKDYNSAFFEVLHPTPYKEIRQRSLIWKLEGVNDGLETLWDETFKEKVETTSIVDDLPKMRIVQEFYQLLTCKAKTICDEITSQNFNSTYSYLLGIDYVLQELLEVMYRIQDYSDDWFETSELLKQDSRFLGIEQYDESFGRYSNRSMRRQPQIDESIFL
ncbi:DUF7006 family protein [Enterococcus sp. DIV0800]|uniref:DUF7006 family protein n=1 Tax=unclassified Enterococcus TaxID=2608891 RepID=UPI003D300F30